MTNGQPTIQIKHRTIWVPPPRAFVAAIVCLVSAVLYFFYLASLQRGLADIVDQGKAAHESVKVQLSELNASYLDDVMTLLIRVSAQDRTGVKPVFEEVMGFAKSADAELRRADHDLRVIHAGGKSWFFWELKSAIANASSVVTRLAALRSDAATTRSRRTHALSELEGVLREETAALYDEVRNFYVTLGGVLLEREKSPTHRSAADEGVRIRAEAERFARVASLVYGPRSLIQKRLELEGSQPELADLARNLTVSATDRQVVAKAIRTVSAPQPVASVTRPSWRVIAAELTLRHGPSDDTEGVCVLRQNDAVLVRAEETSWWHVEASCGAGWVSPKYLAR